MKSSSSLIKDHLLTKEKGFTFTTKDIAQTLHLTNGSVSGFVNTLLKNQVVTAVNKVGNLRTYMLNDLKALAAVHVKSAPGHGSYPGRNYAKGKQAPVPTAETITNQLLDIAAQLERIRPDLATIPTEELIAELQRRVK